MSAAQVLVSIFIFAFARHFEGIAQPWLVRLASGFVIFWSAATLFVQYVGFQNGEIEKAQFGGAIADLSQKFEEQEYIYSARATWRIAGCIINQYRYSVIVENTSNFIIHLKYQNQFKSSSKSLKSGEIYLIPLTKTGNNREEVLKKLNKNRYSFKVRLSGDNPLNPLTSSTNLIEIVVDPKNLECLPYFLNLE